MTDYGTSPQPASFFSSPRLPAAALAGVRSRRLLAFGFDFVVVSILALLLWAVLTVATIGFAAVVLPTLWPFVAFFYNGLTVSGPHGGTPGMRFFDLEMRSVDGTRVSFIQAGVHAALLYVTWVLTPFILLVSLFTGDKRCLHDIFASVIVVRRPD